MRGITTNTTKIEENIFGRIDTTLVEKTVDAKRFNNKHSSIYGDLQSSPLNLSWAARLDFNLAATYRYDARQHGQRISKTPAGDANTRLASVFPMLKYEKGFSNNLKINYTGTLTFARSETSDSTRNVYDWEGNTLPLRNQKGSEILSQPSLRQGENLSTSHRLNLTYPIYLGHIFSANNFFAYSRVEGEDPVGNRITLGGELVDPNTIPSHFVRNIIGMEMRSKFLRDDALESTVFGKHYYYNAESIDILQRNATRLPVRRNSNSYLGFGIGLKYSFNPRLFVRGSFERTARIPTESEIFGNFTFIIPNYTLKAERSNNITQVLCTTHN
jgi:outer membrane receptor protein involved in Fe transport